MNLKQYVPVSIGIFAGAILLARFLGVPFAPFALVIVFGETIIGLQVENQRVLRFLEDVFRGFKTTPRHH